MRACGRITLGAEVCATEWRLLPALQQCDGAQGMIDPTSRHAQRLVRMAAAVMVAVLVVAVVAALWRRLT